MRRPPVGAIIGALTIAAVAVAVLFARSMQIGVAGKTNAGCPSSHPRASVAGTLGSGPGQAPLTRGSAPPWPPTPSPTPVPIADDGRVAVTDANNHQTITVPKGTMIDVNLSANGWTLPGSSDPALLPRISATSRCDTSVAATFAALGSGTITAVGGGGTSHGGPTITFEVQIQSS